MRALTFLCFMALAILTGCSSPKKDPPISLRIAVNDIYCTETACACVHDVAARDYGAVLDRLRNGYSVDLQLDYFIEPYQLEEAILSGSYDGVLSKPWFTLRLQEHNGADYVRVVDLLDPNNNQWLTGIVIVPAESPIQSLKELNGKRVYLGETDAYEKHYAAKQLFAENNIQPSILGTHASCSENIGVLLDEEADASVVSDYALSADCAVDFANPEDFRTIARTQKMPLTSLMVDQNKVDRLTISKLQKSLIHLSDEGLLGKGFVEPAPWNPVELEMKQ